ADRALHAVFGAELLIDHVDRVLSGVERRERRNVGIKRRVRDRELQLIHAVVEDRVLIGSEADAVVENSEAAADYRLLPSIHRRAGRPGEADTWSDAAIVGRQRLYLVAQPETQRQIRTHAPVILHERAGIPPHQADVGLTRLDGELRR